MKKITLIPLAIAFVFAVGALIWARSGSPGLIATVSYSCDAGKTIDAKFYKGKDISGNENTPPIPGGRVVVSLDKGPEATLRQTISADGTRYVNDDESFIFWSKGNSAIIMRNNELDLSYVNCRNPVSE